MSAITDELHNLVTMLENEGHALADRFRAVVAKLKGDAGSVEAEAVADATQVAHDASAAMGPVLAEAEKDAAKVEAKAVADVQQVVTDATQPPAASA